MGFSAFSGLLLREIDASVIFLFLSLIAALFGGIFIFTTQNTPVRESPKDAMIFLFLFWLITPLVFAFPYQFSGLTPNMAHSYFESVSAFTTTGASTLTPESVPRSFLLFRAILQACGGVVAATFAVVILAALNLTGTGVHRSKLFTLKRGDLFPRLLAIGRIVLVVYAGISVVCFLLLAVLGTPIFESICLSLSAISTGGLSPRSGGLSNFMGPMAIAVLAITCLLGASNIAVLWDFVRLKSRRANYRMLTNLEHRGMLVIIAALMIFGVFYAGIANLYPVLIESVFMVTTAGFDYEVLGIDIIAPSLLIMAALVGGSAISTAGGLKIIRMILLLSHASTDIERMSHPSRVKLVHFRGQVLPDQAFMSVWMYFFGYTLVFAGGIVALGATGIPYAVAVSASAASLSNIGPLLGATFPLSDYPTKNSLQLFVMAILMLIGRVEVLAALALFTPSLWRK